MLLGRIQLGVTAEHPSPSLPADLQVPGRGEIAPAVADAPPGAAGRVSSRTGATPTTPAAPVTVGLPRFCPPLGGRSPPPSQEWLGLHWVDRSRHRPTDTAPAGPNGRDLRRGSGWTPDCTSTGLTWLPGDCASLDCDPRSARLGRIDASAECRGACRAGRSSLLTVRRRRAFVLPRAGWMAYLLIERCGTRCTDRSRVRSVPGEFRLGGRKWLEREDSNLCPH